MSQPLPSYKYDANGQPWASWDRLRANIDDAIVRGVKANEVVYQANAPAPTWCRIPEGGYHDNSDGLGLRFAEGATTACGLRPHPDRRPWTAVHALSPTGSDWCPRCWPTTPESVAEQS